MNSQECKTLNVIAHEAFKFGSLYRVPAQRSFVGHSPRPGPSAPVLPVSEVVFSQPHRDPSLNALAHQYSDTRIPVYPDLRDQFRATYDRKFFAYRHTPSPRPLRSELAELNRLAKLFTLCPSATIQGSDIPRLSTSMDSGITQMTVNSLLGFTRNGKLSTFEQCFPATTRPRVEMFSGQPRVPRDTFNSLLKSKLSQLRSTLGVSSTPNGSVTLIASWINKLLCSVVPKTHPRQKKTKDQPIPDKGKKTKVPFVANLSGSAPAEAKKVTEDSSTLIASAVVLSAPPPAEETEPITPFSELSRLIVLPDDILTGITLRDDLRPMFTLSAPYPHTSHHDLVHLSRDIPAALRVHHALTSIECQSTPLAITTFATISAFTQLLTASLRNKPVPTVFDLRSSRIEQATLLSSAFR
jgi:hypothetical protein